MTNDPGSEKKLLEQAREAETNNESKKAGELYKKLIAMEPLKPLFYDRLMIIYRKLKQYKNELKVINRGVKTFEKHFGDRAKKIYSKHKRKVTQLSNELMKKTGLKTINHEYLPEPLNRWTKRKELVELKLKNAG
jgi:hypothetical protein